MAMSPTDIQNKISGISASKKVFAIAGIAATIATVIAVVLW